MNIYFAPLEGVTDEIFRSTHHKLFGGVTKYFIPFICPTQHKVFPPKEYRAILPENNAGVPVVPQILTRNADHFVWAACEMAEMGYTEVNLNVGCPSGTVTAKGKGSGMLREPAELRSFLDEVFAKCPISVSIKTRIGFYSVDEWPGILDIYAAYPVSELIVHPRTRGEFYNGAPHAELCAAVLENTELPLIYNGDLFTAGDCQSMLARYPAAKGLMLGRGLIANPAIARQLAGGAALSVSELRYYHDALYRAYAESWPKNALLGRMHEIAFYISGCFEDNAKARKAIRKSANLPAYEEAIDRLFECGFKADPGFSIDKKVSAQWK